MKYMLVLQWPASSIKDYDDMVAFENSLTDPLEDFAEIDGHDAGSGEVIIFIRTNDPERAFLQIKTIVGSKDFIIGLKAAYRQLTGDEYTILWPKGLKKFTVK